MASVGCKPANNLTWRYEAPPAVVFFRDEAGSPEEGRQPLRICDSYRGGEAGKQVFEVVPCHGKARVKLHVLLGCCEYPGDGCSLWRPADGGHVSWLEFGGP